MASLKQVTEESRQMRDWLSVTSLKQAMATELWRGRMADSRCRRGEGLMSRGGLPLPEGRGPGVLVAEKDWSVRYESTDHEQKNGVE